MNSLKYKKLKFKELKNEELNSYNNDFLIKVGMGSGFIATAAVLISVT